MVLNSDYKLSKNSTIIKITFLYIPGGKVDFWIEMNYKDLTQMYQLRLQKEM